MSNPLYNAMARKQSSNINNFFNALNQLKKSFSGDPQQQVQNMLNSGKITQEQYNRAVKQAQELQKMMNTKP